MKKMLFLVNPKAGKGAIRNDLLDIVLIFSNAGYEVILYPTKDSADAERKIKEDGDCFDIIVCAGGDGTLDNVVRGYFAKGLDVPLGYIPVGTTNDFARTIKLSRKPTEAARQIVNGKVNKFDVGKFCDKNFIYIAAFGLFTDVSYNTNQSLKKVLGHSAYLVEAVKNITNYKGFYINAEFDGSRVSGEYIFGMITNSYSVAGFRIRGAKHVVLDDGKFDCLLVKKPSTVIEFQMVATAFLTNNFFDNEMFYMCKASKVSIKSTEAIAWTLDGDYGGSYEEIQIDNIEKAIGILVDTGSDYDDIDYKDIYDSIEE